MSKNTATQTAVQTTPETKKADKKPVKLFGLSKDELGMVVGGGVIIIAPPKP